VPTFAHFVPVISGASDPNDGKINATTDAAATAP